MNFDLNSKFQIRSATCSICVKTRET